MTERRAYLDVGVGETRGVVTLDGRPERLILARDSDIACQALGAEVVGRVRKVERTLALVMAFAGLAAIMGGNGIAASEAKLPGIVMALIGSIGFAVGTVLSKRWPLHLPPIPGAAWQVGLGCLPVAIVGLAVETAHWSAVTPLGWWLLFYSTVGQFCVAYLSWFAALARLPASVAAIGTMAVPVIGVAASALALHEPLGIGQIAALVFTLAGVALATQS